MANKNKILIFGGVIIIAAGIAFYSWKNLGDKMGQETNINAPTAGPSQQLPSGGGAARGEDRSVISPSKPVSRSEQDKTDIKNIAKFFTEMLGSYSADAKFQNVIDLKPLMTENMQKWADDFIERNMAEAEQGGERVTTTVIKSEIINYSTSRGEVFLETRRVRTIGDQEKIINQGARVSLVKIGDRWLVDSIVWQ